ncbi:MAG TPA: ABC transporter permease [Nitrospirota bacterium]|nr:ABC transporter permease [Nitrospirota bacterium]
MANNLLKGEKPEMDIAPDSVTVQSNITLARHGFVKELFSSNLTIVIALLIAVLIGGAIFVPTMMQSNNLINVVRTSAIVGTVAIGSTLVLLVGELDLSLGGTMCFSLILGSLFIGKSSEAVVLTVTVLSGLVLGTFNGFIVTKFKINSFMATLSTLIIFSGIANLVAGGKTAYLYQSPFYMWLGKGSLSGIPVPIIIFFVFVIILSIVLHFTKLGMEIYFTGANALAAWYAGIHTSAIKIFAFAVSGFCSAVAGIFLVGQINEIVPTIGPGYELTGLAIAVFGGTSMRGGTGSILGTAVAVITFELLINILTLSGMGTYMEGMLKGVFLIIIVIVFEKLNKRKRV